MFFVYKNLRSQDTNKVRMALDSAEQLIRTNSYSMEFVVSFLSFKRENCGEQEAYKFYKQHFGKINAKVMSAFRTIDFMRQVRNEMYGNDTVIHEMLKRYLSVANGNKNYFRRLKDAPDWAKDEILFLLIDNNNI